MTLLQNVATTVDRELMWMATASAALPGWWMPVGCAPALRCTWMQPTCAAHPASWMQARAVVAVPNSVLSHEHLLASHHAEVADVRSC